MSVTSERLASLIQRELAPILTNNITNKKVGYVNITEVRVTRDKQIATIFYTILSDEEDIIKLAAEELEKKNATIRMNLAQKIRNLRKMPELNFKYDEALAYGNHIDKLMKTIK